MLLWLYLVQHFPSLNPSSLVLLPVFTGFSSADATKTWPQFYSLLTENGVAVNIPFCKDSGQNKM